MNFPWQWEKFQPTHSQVHLFIVDKHMIQWSAINKRIFPPAFIASFPRCILNSIRQWFHFPRWGKFVWVIATRIDMCTRLEKCSWAILWIFREIKLKFKRREFDYVRALGERFFIDLQSRAEKLWRIQMIRIERKAIKFDLFHPRLRNIIQEN